VLQAIAAIATPFGKGAIAIIRVSGKDSITHIQTIFKGRNLLKAKPNTITHGKIVSNGQTIDEVMVAIYHGPKSYTGEDMVEIFTHGGILVTEQVLQAILTLPIERALPGAFTERAYVNGKLDLLQAESVMDMIEADNKYALEIAKKGLFSELSIKMQSYRDMIMSLIAHIEVNIDYPEYESEHALTQTSLIPNITSLRDSIDVLMIESIKNKLIKEGIKTAIIGKPNVGKSSLLNALINEEKAIVTHIPGTTRDIVEATLNLDGITLQLLDTAGIRETEDVVEQIGIKRSERALSEADLILFLLDVSEPLDTFDVNLLERIKHKPHLVIGNKMDLNIHHNSHQADIYISTKTKENLNQLKDQILKKLHIEAIETRDLNYLSNQRHLDLLSKTLKHLNEALDNAMKNEVIDVIQLDLRHSWEALSEISGTTFHESLVEDMFRRFCLGK
jgi:tRNA modification GTPase